MKTKLCVLAAFLVVALSPAFGQIIKDKTITACEYKTIPALITPLTEGQTYRFIRPDKLNYWKLEQKQGGQYGVSYSRVYETKAKLQDTQEMADLNFEIITPGLTLIKMYEPYTTKNGWKYIDLRYSFPYKVVVKDKSGNVLKTYILSDDKKEYTATYHPRLFNDAEFDALPDIEVTYGFAGTAEEVKAQAEKDINKILARMEYNKLYEFQYTANKVLTYAYGGIKFTYKPQIVDVDKKYKNAFPELNSAVAKLQGEISEVFTSPMTDDLKARLRESAIYFTSQYGKGASSKDMIKICSFNAAMAYLLIGDIDASYKCYRDASASFGLFSKAIASYFDYYDILAYAWQAACKDETCTVKPVVELVKRSQNEGHTR